ncbi:hypothetical protein [Enterovirga rhinocerotis]|uniref:Uncharacterized protein n=1 Tax=Enterovirga rhinocerotis TaxID=1339210 RepID=A0A4R7BND3_9HYPH|nr:hypothetical protein [Enterovirga rhinocerotis]TDR85437.1 hypothetical protein EV668_4558 [Enterovirga rhinocerotis]
MRFLLLLLLAAVTALAVPYVLHEARSELFPPGTDVMRAFQDAREIAGHLIEALRTGEEPPVSQPLFEEARLWSTGAVMAVAACWFQGYVFGGIVGLILMNVRPVTLGLLGILFLFGVFSCTGVQVTHDFSAETVSVIRQFAALQLAAALAGFLTARGFRRTTI